MKSTQPEPDTIGVLKSRLLPFLWKMTLMTPFDFDKKNHAAGRDDKDDKDVVDKIFY